MQNSFRIADSDSLVNPEAYDSGSKCQSAHWHWYVFFQNNFYNDNVSSTTTIVQYILTRRR